MLDGICWIPWLSTIWQQALYESLNLTEWICGAVDRLYLYATEFNVGLTEQQLYSSLLQTQSARKRVSGAILWWSLLPVLSNVCTLATPQCIHLTLWIGHSKEVVSAEAQIPSLLSYMLFLFLKRCHLKIRWCKRNFVLKSGMHHQKATNVGLHGSNL